MSVVTNTSQVSAAGLVVPTAGSTTPKINKKDAAGALDKDAFLKLLAAQARSQDPMSPTDSTAQIAQLAQFSSLEQMSNVATQMSTMAAAVNKQGATALVGRTVTYKGNDGLDATGTVSKVTMSADGPLLSVGSVDNISPATLLEVR